jgi:serine/threonine-protein kinase
VSQGPDQKETSPSADAPTPGPVRKKASLAELLAELKRRRVFRVMAGYGLFSFAVLQVVEPLMHAFDLPGWLLKASVLALVAGLPVAVVLAWVFDLTADGVVRTPRITGGPRLSRRRAAMLLVGVALVAALPGIGWYAWKRGKEAAGAAAAEGNASIAVLPFDDLSPGRDQEYFSDGVAGEILNALSRVEGLKVPGRASSFWFKGKRAEPSEIASKLGVAHLLEGSVRRSGKALRIDAEVIRAADGLRLWAQTFNREEADIFAIQDEIARAVVEALKVRLLPGRVVTAAPGGSRNPEAYRLYLLGRDLDARGTPEAYAASVKVLKEAVQLDPGFVAARAWLIVTITDVFDAGPSDLAHGNRPEFSQAALEGALRSADALVAEAPGEPEPWARRGLLRGVFFSQWADALADLQRALAITPNDEATLRGQAQALAALGRLAEAKEVLRRVITIDPLKAEAYQWLGSLEATSGELERGITTLRRGLEIDPSQPYVQRELAFATLLQGKPQDALALIERNPLEWMRDTGRGIIHHTLGHDDLSRAAIARLQARDRLGVPTHYQLAQVHAWRGELDQAFQRLELAYASHDGGLQHLRYDPLLHRLRADPRYLALIRKFGLPPLPGEAPTAVTPSIAVLPLVNLSSDKEQEYFSDGLTEELLNLLAKVPGLRVASRTSAFAYKGKAVKASDIGRELGVTHLLEGSVQRSGGRVRITTQLVKASDGFHLWSEAYERKLTDVFAVQDEIAAKVVGALKLQLLPAPVAKSHRTESPEAHDLYLRGLHFWNVRTAESLEKAAAYFERAIQADPSFALAYAGVALAIEIRAGYTWDRDPVKQARAKAAALFALELDPELAEAHAALGLMASDRFELPTSLEHYRKAVALRPAYASAHQWYGGELAHLGRAQEARRELEEALRLDPSSRVINYTAGLVADLARDDARAERFYRAALELAPGWQTALRGLAALYAWQGRRDEALAALAGLDATDENLDTRIIVNARLGRREDAERLARELEAVQRRRYVPAVLVAAAWAALGDKEKAFAELDRTCREKDGAWEVNPKVDRWFDGLRSDPRLGKILACLNLQ